MMAPSAARRHGMTLIELMVALAIGLILSLAIFGVMATSEGRKRTTTATNDVNQVGAFTLFQLDKAIRSAGTGFAQSNEIAFGCQINASNKGAQVLPPTGALPAPFQTLLADLGKVALAPVIIAHDGSTNISAENPGGAKSDVLLIMAGSSGFGEIMTESASPPSASSLGLVNTISMRALDMLLVTERAGGATQTPCLIEQIDKDFDNSKSFSVVKLSGDYYSATGANRALTDYSASAQVLNLGQTPSFQAIGVGDNNILYDHDLLHVGGTAPTPIADNVVELHALYGTSATPTGTLTWIDPGASASFAASTTGLLDGSSGAAARLKSIRAIRVGLIVRAPLQEKPDAITNAPVSPATLTLFSDLGAGFTYTKTLTASERNYRYRVLESTIPLRNQLLLQ
ncbi:type IV pilus assembly protein PilW [Actimicrobium sp. GrIS 1.19]|uniref:PilW family protein n=1 Tax=Actimicrobium sp. GrIS 1.19 TaxID=3071708 RepID=UPI002E057C0C|nr:type IV pilus assembly protein PilW [Actimicrobium sp. GrIS 1.19]